MMPCSTHWERRCGLAWTAVALVATRVRMAMETVIEMVVRLQTHLWMRCSLFFPRTQRKGLVDAAA